MHEYFERLARIAREHGFESFLEHPEREVDTPRHYLRIPARRLGPFTIWPARTIAEIVSEAFAGHEMDDRESADPAESALEYQGLRLHVLRSSHHGELVRLMDHLRKALKEPVSAE